LLTFPLQSSRRSPWTEKTLEKVCSSGLLICSLVWVVNLAWGHKNLEHKAFSKEWVNTDQLFLAFELLL
jgi:hypothetical protein